MAVKGNNVDIVLVLLKPDSSIVYIEENKGNTPLHIATRKGRPDVSETLRYLEEEKLVSKSVGKR
ncbi:hypothetical protein HPP92_025300 [Vanilla planifolia]|uniref:Uncharacterized protein n=1 Tax=Vanilla planifolia TaxID=51239 RepID=A0A835PHM2_VANPL|nr:hypothetical protein HPP92_025300 [Vanilla planifolia]